jgi:hypothetical protein
MPTQKPLIESTPLTKRESASVIESDNIEESVKRSKAISARDFLNWIEGETDAHLQTRPSALTDFRTTFDAPSTQSASKQESYKNSLGETHVVTRIGHRDVCFMDSNQHIKDDWSAGLVMFYDCDNRNKQEFKLP